MRLEIEHVPRLPLIFAFEAPLISRSTRIEPAEGEEAGEADDAAVADDAGDVAFDPLLLPQPTAVRAAIAATVVMVRTVRIVGPLLSDPAEDDGTDER